MPNPAVLRLALVALVLTLASPLPSVAQAPRDQAGKSAAPARPAPSPGRYGPAKGPLPDPVLLDGSTLEPEKRPEYGMLGEFEIPGDEDAKSEKVGGEQQQPGGGGSQSMENAAQAAGGGGAAGAQQQAGKGSQAPEKNDPGAAAEGSQVGELKSDGATGGAGQEGPQKPQQVALGDTAMQIKPQTNVPGVVGAQQLPTGKEVPQQYDKKTPAGNQPPSRGNQGVEKGRVMPSGI